MLQASAILRSSVIAGELLYAVSGGSGGGSFQLFASVYSGLIINELCELYALTYRSCCRRFHRLICSGRVRVPWQGLGGKILPEASEARCGDFSELVHFTLAERGGVSKGRP